MENYRVEKIDGRRVTFKDGQEIEFDFEVGDLTSEEWEEIYARTCEFKRSLEGIRSKYANT